ncbi:helix-turn-helix domain-containing protein [Isachenkonia alkalipeptolytica]|uniref:helix-turn-helix domain-containing protein n=1 Tax=Isachenkonia alkalipeptolytica TaxID=2565777 RepID=UPI00352F7660
MLRHKAYKFRIYPNREQEILIAKTIGCSRFVYNHFLRLWNEAYAATGKGLTYHACAAMIPQMKKNEGTLWLQEVDSISLQSSVKIFPMPFPDFSKNKITHRSLKVKRTRFKAIQRKM